VSTILWTSESDEERTIPQNSIQWLCTWNQKEGNIEGIKKKYQLYKKFLNLWGSLLFDSFHFGPFGGQVFYGNYNVYFLQRVVCFKGPIKSVPRGLEDMCHLDGMQCCWWLFVWSVAFWQCGQFRTNSVTQALKFQAAKLVYCCKMTSTSIKLQCAIPHIILSTLFPPVTRHQYDLQPHNFILS